ncbi:uncharacterized protein J3R85_005112 [Psidium guajava]|nr:uncharacterized protein J3R85_005112 [Psidium guajava]
MEGQAPENTRSPVDDCDDEQLRETRGFLIRGTIRTLVRRPSSPVFLPFLFSAKNPLHRANPRADLFLCSYTSLCRPPEPLGCIHLGRNLFYSLLITFPCFGRNYVAPDIPCYAVILSAPLLILSLFLF